ncbi:Protein of unknown function [Pyronema omphalodes CBS 100304]|uniref:Uncharacterized protein n=1 Tax=Pyronema omphalodes (strain CBS 100304) TaxID=1076935 RepID=U4L002_PYROM|nr:Protein of unknown function [Pyronema omphalodes CBS 100304]
MQNSSYRIVIVYDAQEHTLLAHKWKCGKDNTPGFRRASEQLPRWRNQFDVYICGNGGQLDNNRPCSDFIATVKLNTLPFLVDLRRHLGQIKDIYVKCG